MCRVDGAEPWDFYVDELRLARRSHGCFECGRSILAGERYRRGRGMFDNQWVVYKVCTHCDALATALYVWCGGYMHTELEEELLEHWYDEGLRSLRLGRWLMQLKHDWHDGRDPVPSVDDVRAEALRVVNASWAG